VPLTIARFFVIVLRARNVRKLHDRSLNVDELVP